MEKVTWTDPQRQKVLPEGQPGSHPGRGQEKGVLSLGRLLHVGSFSYPPGDAGRAESH